MTPPPLVVDLDGSLLRSDTLLESFFALLAERPFAAIGALGWLFKGRASFKRQVATLAPIDPGSLPYSDAVLAEIASARQAGQEVWLVSASDAFPVHAVADHLGLFDGVMGSNGTINLRGSAKASALVAKFGAREFDYLGNERNDFAVWEHARRVLIAHPTAGFQRQVERRFDGAQAVGAPTRVKDRLAALRPHQWLKNLLVFVPVLAAHSLRATPILAAILAFIALSLTASSLYLVNDLIDLGRDRAHPTKRRRPLASGKVPLQDALIMVPLLLVGALVAAAGLPRLSLAVIAAYAVASLSYSLVLKRLIMIDVVMLACLYGSRLLLGSVSSGVKLTAWLAAFSLFLFYSLALVKRMTELAQKPTTGTIAGRAYQSGDEPLIAALAAAAGMVSVLVFALYINSPGVRELYRYPSHLWFVCVVLLYWVGRVLLLAHRGKIHADPLIFAATDKISLASIILAALIVASAI